jgi:hypothetical protein
LATEEKEDGAIWNNPLRRDSRRFVSKNDWRRGKRVGEGTTRGRTDRLVELGLLRGKVGREVQ